MLLVFLYVCSTAMFYTKKSRVIKFWGFFMYLLFLGIVQNNTMKLDNALTQIGKLFLGKNLSDVICFFPSFLPRAFNWNGITGFQNSLQVWRLKFQIGIVSFSLHLSCQILVHRLGWKELRLGNKTSRHWGRRSSGPWLSVRAPGFCFLVCLVLRFWPVVPFIVSRENLRLVFYVFSIL